MRITRLLRAAGLSLGLSTGPLCLWVGLGLGPATLVSGCGETQQSGRVVEIPEEVKEQQSSLKEDMSKIVAERRAAALKRGR
jgi:hypothetical protein